MNTIYVVGLRSVLLKQANKGQVKLVPVFNKMLRYEDLWGVEVLLQAFLRLTLDRGERLATRIDQLTPGERAPLFRVIRGRFRPTVGRVVVEERKTAPPAGNLDSGSPLFQPLARMSCHHPSKTSHLISLNVSATDYLRSPKVVSSPQHQVSYVISNRRDLLTVTLYVF